MGDAGQSQEKLRELFRALREALEASRIVVRVNTRTYPHEFGQHGSFDQHPSPNWLGDVQILRDQEDVPGEPVDELLTLAHEAGHAVSFMRRLSSDEYRAILGKVRHQGATLTPAQKTLVLNEEARAWVLARNELAALGFDSWSSYADRTTRSLTRYGELLAIAVDVQDLLSEQAKALSSQGLIGASNLRPPK